MRHHCPICYEVLYMKCYTLLWILPPIILIHAAIIFEMQYLFDSLKDTTVMKCGHTMHTECYHEMIKRDK